MTEQNKYKKLICSNKGYEDDFNGESNSMLHVFKLLPDNTWLHVNVTHFLINKLRSLEHDGPSEDYQDITEDEFEKGLNTVLGKLCLK